MAGPVTDPELLQRLKAKSNPTLALFDPTGNAPLQEFGPEAMQPPVSAPEQQRKPVADMDLVQRLDQKRLAPKDDPSQKYNMAERTLASIGDNPVSKGLQEGLTNRGIGVIQTGYDVMKTLGLIDADPEFEAAVLKANAKTKEAAVGTGVGGAVGELIGDPINWIGGGAIGGATIKGLGKAAAVKKLAMQGARAGAITGAASGATGVRQEGETRLENTLEQGATGAVLGAALPAGARALGKSGRGVNEASKDIIAAGVSGAGRTAEQLDEAVSKLYDEGDTLFTQMRQNNVSLTPQGGASLARDGQAAFATDRLDAGRHPVTTAVLRDLVDQVQNGVPNAVNPNSRSSFDVVAFDMLRRRLGDAVGEDGAQAGKLREALFSAIKQPNALAGAPAALDNLDMALQQWQKASRVNELANLAKKANNDPNRIRTQVDNFTDKPKNTQGLLPNELEMLARSGKRTFGDKALGLVGGIGVDMGSINRNPRSVVPYLIASGKIGGSATIPGAAIPVAVGTAANSVRNRIANGKLERAIREVEKRQITAPSRAPAAAVATPTPQLTGPASPLALPAPTQVMIPGGPGGALRPATDVERAAMYAQQGKVPELEVSPAGLPRAPSTVQQEANNSMRSQYQGVSLTPDVLRAQRARQVATAEAQKTAQDQMAAKARASQLQNSRPQATVADLFEQAQTANADRAAAVGQPVPELSQIGQALADAVKAKKQPLKITVKPRPSWYVPEEELPKLNLPSGGLFE